MRLRSVVLGSLALILSVVLGVAGVAQTPQAFAQAVPAVPIQGPCILIYPPPPGCGGGPTITTDQPQYGIGSPIRICYTVPGPGPVTIVDQQPGGLSHTLLSAYDDGTGWCFPGTITPPAGTECLYLYFGGGSYYPGSPGYGGPPPPPAYGGGGSPAQTCFQVFGYGYGYGG